MLFGTKRMVNKKEKVGATRKSAYRLVKLKGIEYNIKKPTEHPLLIRRNGWSFYMKYFQQFSPCRFSISFFIFMLEKFFSIVVLCVGENRRDAVFFSESRGFRAIKVDFPPWNISFREGSTLPLGTINFQS